jgi:hypothetical protein
MRENAFFANFQIKTLRHEKALQRFFFGHEKKDLSN